MAHSVLDANNSTNSLLSSLWHFVLHVPGHVMPHGIRCLVCLLCVTESDLACTGTDLSGIQHRLPGHLARFLPTLPCAAYI